MGSKAKTSEPTIMEESIMEESIIDKANKYLDIKISEGIPITQSFRKLFYLNYIESKNLDMSWRKTSGN
jgi:hypothetical protein